MSKVTCIAWQGIEGTIRDCSRPRMYFAELVKNVTSIAQKMCYTFAFVYFQSFIN